MPAQNWDRRLTRIVSTKDGHALRTLADARAFVIERVPEGYQRRQYWQHAAKLMMEASEGRETTEAVTWQLEYALLHDGRAKL